MQWSDVTKAPNQRTLRQFGLLCLVVFVGMAGLRVYRGHTDAWAIGLASAGTLLGFVGVVAPLALRYVFTGWMMVAFPIGWVVSRVVLGIMFYLLFTPISFVFSVIRRDALHRRRQQQSTYWTPKRQAEDARSYFRQF
jgi:hypothetical protein